MIIPSPTEPRASGNIVINTSPFDRAGRLTSTERKLTSNGAGPTGSNPVIGSIVTSRGYDKNSRLTTQTDNNGNTTTTIYDSLDRPTIIRNADLTEKMVLYDHVSNPILVEDERGVVTTSTFDKLGRVKVRSILNPPAGPGQTTYETYAYDGLSRMTRGENNHAIIALTYDSLGPVISEDQTVYVGSTDRLTTGDSWGTPVQKVTTSTYDGRRGRKTYRVASNSIITETRDALNRIEKIEVGSPALTVGTYDYIGRGARVLERVVGKVTLFRSYDGDRRVTRHDHRTISNLRLAGFTYNWDRVGNRWNERTLTNNSNTTETGGSGEAYAYDSVYRMVENVEGVSSGSLDTITSNAPTRPVLSGTAARQYVLDGLGNRSEVVKDGEVETVYGLAASRDFLMNQYTWVNDTFQSYDRAGNLLHDGTWRFFYSARNQLTQGLSGSTDARYRHDVLGRRVSKRLASGNFPGWSYGHAVYIHDGQRIVEEYDTAGARRKEWIYGIGIDEPLRQQAPDYADIDSDSNTAELVLLYYLTNSLGTVVGLYDAVEADVRERYVYNVWGAIRDVKDKSGGSTGASWTLVGNPWCFTGRQFEFEERNDAYHFRARSYQPKSGRFVQRDPLGRWSPGSLGNAHNYAAGSPTTFTDPSGALIALSDWTSQPVDKDCNALAWTVFSKLVLPVPAGSGAAVLNLSNQMETSRTLFAITFKYELSIPLTNPKTGADEQYELQGHTPGSGTSMYIRKNYCLCDGPELTRLVSVLIHESIHAMANAGLPPWNRWTDQEPVPDQANGEPWPPGVYNKEWEYYEQKVLEPIIEAAAGQALK